MRIPFFCLALIFGVSLGFAQSRPGPPGLQAARQYEATHPLEPPRVPARRVDRVKVQREADELSTLAQSIPACIQGTAQGVLSKDLVEKLKRIEKLSKRLRSELLQ